MTAVLPVSLAAPATRAPPSSMAAISLDIDDEPARLRVEVMGSTSYQLWMGFRIMSLQGGDRALL